MSEKNNFMGEVNVSCNGSKHKVVFDGTSALSEEILPSTFGMDVFSKGTDIWLSWDEETEKRPKLYKLSGDCLNIKLHMPVFQDILGRVL